MTTTSATRAYSTYSRSSERTGRGVTSARLGQLPQAGDGSHGRTRNTSSRRSGGENVNVYPRVCSRSGRSYDTPAAIRISEHMDGTQGEAMFRHACAMGLEGIVSKKVTAPYLSPVHRE